MSGERLLSSFIVRVTIRNGKRLIAVYDVADRSTTLLQDYAELPGHFAASEDARVPGTDSSDRKRRKI